MVAKCLFRLELEFHGGNIQETHACLKKHVGTNEISQTFYQLLASPDEPKGLISRLWNQSAAKVLLNKLAQSKVGLYLKHGLKLLAQIFYHSSDLIKDIFFLIIYSQFFPVSRNDFDTFQFQLFFILLLTIVLPNLLNIVVLLLESPSHLTVRGRVVLVMFCSVSQTVLGYATSKMRFAQEKLLMSYSELTSQQSMNLTEKLKRLEIKICSLARLQSKLWLNEGVFESTVQALILLIAIAMRFRYAIKSLPQHCFFCVFLPFLALTQMAWLVLVN